MESLKAKAYDIIKKKIISCELLPGEAIDEKLLIQQTGCGRTPVREALTLLANEDLVKIYARRGIFVSEVSIRDIQDMYSLREEVEPIIIRKYGSLIPKEQLQKFEQLFTSDLAPKDYTQTDKEFHAAIINACENKYLRRIVQLVDDQSQRVRLLTNEDAARLRESTEEHLAIIRALLADDYECAAEAMKVHYLQSLKHILKFDKVSDLIKR